MAIRIYDEDAPAPGVPVPWPQADGSTVTLHVRPVPVSVRRRIEQAIAGPVKAKKFTEQSMARVGEQAQKITAQVAAYALVDSEGFEIESASPKFCAAMSEAGIAMKPGEAAKLDGKWSDALKDIVFGKHPTLASFVVEAADKLAGTMRDAEVELGETS